MPGMPKDRQTPEFSEKVNSEAPLFWKYPSAAGFHGLFADTSEHIRFYFLIFLFPTVSNP